MRNFYWDCFREAANFINSFYGWWGLGALFLVWLGLRLPSAEHTAQWAMWGEKLAAALPVGLIILFFSYAFFYAPYKKFNDLEASKVLVERERDDLKKMLDAKSESELAKELAAVQGKLTEVTRIMDAQKERAEFNRRMPQDAFIDFPSIPADTSRGPVFILTDDSDSETQSVANSYLQVLNRSGFHSFSAAQPLPNKGIRLITLGEPENAATIQALVAGAKRLTGVTIQVEKRDSYTSTLQGDNPIFELHFGSKP